MVYFKPCSPSAKPQAPQYQVLLGTRADTDQATWVEEWASAKGDSWA